MIDHYLHAIEALAMRAGPAPRMTPSNPQEQLEQFPQDWALIQQLAAHAFSLSQVVEAPTRIAPPGSRAMTLAAEHAHEERDAFLVDYEFAHIHNPPVGSMHLTLPEPIRTAAMQRGWILRHPLAVRGVVSKDTVFAFAPRDAQELAVAKLLLEASHAYASGQFAKFGV